MNELLLLLQTILRASGKVVFVDVFENRKEIWFNYGDKTYKLKLSVVE